MLLKRAGGGGHAIRQLRSDSTASSRTAWVHAIDRRQNRDGQGKKPAGRDHLCREIRRQGRSFPAVQITAHSRSRLCSQLLFTSRGGGPRLENARSPEIIQRVL